MRSPRAARWPASRARRARRARPCRARSPRGAQQRPRSAGRPRGRRGGRRGRAHRPGRDRRPGSPPPPRARPRARRRSARRHAREAPRDRRRCCSRRRRSSARAACRAARRRRSRRGRDHLERERCARRGRAAERQLPVEHDAQPGPDDDANRRGLAAKIGRADGERGGRPARTADAAVARTGRALVPGRDDDERVEPRRAGDGARDRPVGERGERLGDADDGDAGRVEDVAVGVRVDRALEPGEQLVGPAVDGEPALGARLPAGDPDRQDRRAGRDTAHALRPAAADEQARDLGAVPLEPHRLVRMRPRERARVGIEHVDAVEQPVADERVRRVDRRCRAARSSPRCRRTRAAGGRPAGRRRPRTAAREAPPRESDAGYAARTG